MLRSRCFVRVAAIAALPLFLTTMSLADTNVRPQFSVGTSVPVNWGRVDHGQTLGAAIEVEQNSRWSVIAEFEAHWLETNELPYLTFAPAPMPEFGSATLYSGQFGVRMHVSRTSRIRPYVQAGLGVRVGSSNDEPVAVPFGAFLPPLNPVPVDGPTAHVRLGFTTAGWRGAGLFADGSVEALLRRPGNFALAPLRIGIMLP